MGDHVGWNSEAGHVRATVKRKISFAVTFEGCTVRASKEGPQYWIKSETTDHLAMHAQGMSAQETQKQTKSALRIINRRV